jgi:hypothetical protein
VDEANRDPVEATAKVLTRDLVATLGWPVEVAIHVARREADSRARVIRDWGEAEIERLDYWTAEELQQWLHDTFLDVSWPHCPDHGQHPLWLSDGRPPMWTCPSTQAPICQLGELATVVAPVSEEQAIANLERLNANEQQDAAMLAKFGNRRRP